MSKNLVEVPHELVLGAITVEATIIVDERGSLRLAIAGTINRPFYSEVAVGHYGDVDGCQRKIYNAMATKHEPEKAKEVRRRALAKLDAEERAALGLGVDDL